jgi:hypothetical protein
LIQTRPELRESFSKLGDIFWFDQYRNLGFRMAEEMGNGRVAEHSDSTDGGIESHTREGWQAGVEQLREYLAGCGKKQPMP